MDPTTSASESEEEQDDPGAWSTTDEDDAWKLDDAVRNSSCRVYRQCQFDPRRAARPATGPGAERVISGHGSFARKLRSELELKRLLSEAEPNPDKQQEPYELKFQSNVLENTPGVTVIERKSKRILPEEVQALLMKKKLEEGPGTSKTDQQFAVTPDELIQGLFGVPTEEVRNFLRLPQEGLMQLLFEYWTYLNDKYTEEYSEAEDSEQERPGPAPADNNNTDRGSSSLDSGTEAGLKVCYRNINPKAFRAIDIESSEEGDDEYEEGLESVLVTRSELDVDTMVGVNYGKRYGMIGSACRCSYTFLTNQVCASTFSAFGKLIRLLKPKGASRTVEEA